MVNNKLNNLITAFVRSSDYILLLVILSIATYLRFFHLTTSSLWFDELSTMKVCDPQLSWAEWLNNLKIREVMPPLFFFIERLLFEIFGYSDSVVRGFSAVCGVLGVYGIFLVGKELANNKLGLIFASLITVNFYAISYSQEARPYSMALMFTVFCIYSFIRLVKNLRKLDVFVFAFFGTCLLYSIFYSMFTILALGIVMIVQLLSDKENFKLQLKRYSLATLLIFVFCLPLIPIILYASKIRTFWIPPIEPDFAINYFWGYFGNSATLKPIILLLIFVYLIEVFRDKNELSAIRNSLNQFSFLIFSMVVLCSFLIPYIYSITIVPMLFPRYTIEVSAIFVMMVGMGIYTIKNRIFKYSILSTFLILSVLDVFASKKYYANSVYSRPQYKQTIDYLLKFGNNITIIEDHVDGWAHSYYVRKAGYQGRHLYNGGILNTLDSLLIQEPVNDQKSFWVIGGWSGLTKSDTSANSLITKNSSFKLKADTVFEDHFGVGLFARLYVDTLPKDVARLSVRPRSILQNFINSGSSFIDGNSLILYSASLTSSPIKFDTGKYKLALNVRGQKAKGEFAKIQISINEKDVGVINTSAEYAISEFEVQVSKSPAIFKITIENDYWDEHEDRNAFIKSIVLSKIQMIK